MCFALIAGFGGTFTYTSKGGQYLSRQMIGSVLGVVIIFNELAGSAGRVIIGKPLKSEWKLQVGFELMLVFRAVAIATAIMVRRFRTQ
ncbi:MAG: hypothetical protein EOO39_30960 [Cytophagaceae bacterium]|nr:MAG: hypothetical protein EOO39_30960 [Cytophagaceae bacterium]